MKESKFKIGDRVKVFACLNGNLVESKGTILDDIDYPSVLLVNLDKAATTARKLIKAHPKQCRRLIKKELRRVWISESSLDDCMKEDRSVVAWKKKQNVTWSWVEFVEVRRGK